jgi:heme exporter protein A
MELRVDQLAVARGGITVLEGVNFTLPAGRGLVLRGPNGIGKTTLLRCVAGLQPSVAGTVSVGADTIAYAAHADGLKTTLTVTENLAFWAAVYGTAQVDEALTQMNLNDLRDRQAANLSAGQKRRLGLARLLVTGRPIWVLDEPTVSLDTASVALFGDVVRGHLAQGGAVLIATHIDLGLEAEVLDLGPYRASSGGSAGVFDAAFGGDFA